MSLLEYYLVGINIFGAIIYLINGWLYSHTAEKQIDTLVTITSVLGGSAGILLMVLIFNRKPHKETMMSSVFIICIFIIQVILYLVIKGHISSELTFAFWKFFDAHKLLVMYLVGINFVTFAMFALDKIRAIERSRSRIRIVTLLGLAFLGGSIGALVAMYLLRHKTQKDYFTVGVPLIIIMQIIVLMYAMNASW